MTEPFDSNSAQPPQFPPPGAPGAPGVAPQPGAPAYGAPPPMGAAPSHDPSFAVPAYGEAPPMGAGPQPGAALPGNGVLASFGARLGAMLLDWLFVTLIMAVVAAPLIFFVASGWETELQACTSNGEQAICDVPTDDTIVLILGAFGVWMTLSLIISFIYYIRPVSKTGQTPGRRIAGIKVVNMKNGQPPSFGKAFLRYFIAGFISGSFCYLGFLWMLWDDRSQTWHDKLCDTVVVRA